MKEEEKIFGFIEIALIINIVGLFLVLIMVNISLFSQFCFTLSIFALSVVSLEKVRSLEREWRIRENK